MHVTYPITKLRGVKLHYHQSQMDFGESSFNWQTIEKVVKKEANSYARGRETDVGRSYEKDKNSTQRITRVSIILLIP